ncbi:MAG: 5-bromo-4-chloroindolyl phosphate hydrolysis family protein [Acetatifactor sp.]|nr:5-bromo-4-chloroindolyl phosphate hydrolysis family protein [Acetatifactor sp.]
MADRQNGANLGEQMKSAVAEALQSGDFSDLNRLVTNTVENALKDAKVPDWQERAKQREQQKQQERQQKIQQDWQRKLQAQMLKKNLPAKNIELIKFHKVGSVSSVLYRVFGGIGLGVTGLALFFNIIRAGILGGTGGWLILALFLLLFSLMIRQGVAQAHRLERAERYAELCGSKMYGETDKIAGSTGQSKRSLLKDIRKMLRLGIFPEGHLDERGDWFMLNDVVYHQYQNLEQSTKENEAKQLLEQKGQSQSIGEMISNAKKAQEAELNSMVAEGMEYIRKLRDLNDQIEGEVISAKLYRLENLLNEIFDNVREHPEQMHRMHKLMDYYLPTTLKLVEAYEEFDHISAPGHDILSAKGEIEQTLDIINQAFAELLNNLFQDTVLDVTTDAQVLQTMLAQEGLTRELEFEKVSRK